MCNLIYLLVLSWCVLAKVPSREERITIVECHAKLREEVEPPASNMQLMSYSTKMEKLAQDLFLHCDSGYPEFDPKYQDVGIVELTSENETPRYRDLCKVNGTTYSYNEDRCTGDCLSYLRMVWAASTEVGCATGRCANKADPAERDDFIICTYKPRYVIELRLSKCISVFCDSTQGLMHVEPVVLDVLRVTDAIGINVARIH
uniref:SCP domain-containing protein n=1 Tax=Mesocestoides corti TaxID=53468 RepID=A0A5K3FLA1_MESCO